LPGTKWPCAREASVCGVWIDALDSEVEDSESASDTDDAGHYSGDDGWQYRRIVVRRIDASSRRMALVEWVNTWEPEDELGGSKRALRRYARVRRSKSEQRRRV
jgi:hypothetical protein